MYNMWGEQVHKPTKRASDPVLFAPMKINHCRYDSISTFIYSCGPKGGANSIDRYNDIPCEVDEELQVRSSVIRPFPSLHNSPWIMPSVVC
jgi:hypothetical protein